MAGYGGWGKYVSVAEKRAQAEKKIKALRKKGRVCLPVLIDKRAIAHTFWGKQWCDNLENYSDYANRLPRGRTYVRNGSVVDLQVDGEKISALVAGSSLYEVNITIKALAPALWQSILRDCAGKIASLVELLQGRLSSGVMEVVSQAGSGLFPTPQQISFRCSCPDSASMCKHVAATLYGVGNRFDSAPELLFQLRNVDPAELVQTAVGMSLTQTQADAENNLTGADLSALFGIDLDGPGLTAPPPVGGAQPADADKAVTGKAVIGAAVAAAKPAAPAKPAKAGKPAKTVSARELTARGVPTHMRQCWLKSGVLLATDARAVYALATHGEQAIAAYLARRAS
ncbi:hypothetical protein ACFOLJ_06955 [Rugamonas sp. CCM 8940]|uniref:SWIM zinc finger family protein n=1 Tax=Rugamonas sp. CCM 8940 TaxID=2765359 RepID=UPI0018F42D63|nr:hypothetical protein [Rugamonas sp. CCM 8940]MBJ7310310.1 hypothetical protein [Rugamonas sp. CCM 8940]